MNILTRIASAFRQSRLATALPTKANRALKLYFISHYNGDSLELFVWAHNRRSAVTHWHRYYENEGDKPDHIFHVPLTATEAGAIAWHAPEGIQDVTF